MARTPEQNRYQPQAQQNGFYTLAPHLVNAFLNGGNLENMSFGEEGKKFLLTLLYEGIKKIPEEKIRECMNPEQIKKLVPQDYRPIAEPIIDSYMQRPWNETIDFVVDFGSRFLKNVGKNSGPDKNTEEILPETILALRDTILKLAGPYLKKQGVRV
jgi:hypothetical protein